MSKYALEWDKDGEREYTTGVSNGVLFVKSGATYGKGVAWNGLTKVTESPEGAEETALYADNEKYLSLRSVEEFKATIEAYTYPDEFAVCNGEAEFADGAFLTSQTRATFAFAYMVNKGNDQSDNAGKELHIIYGATAAPASVDHETINDSPAALTFSWEISTVPVEVAVEGKNYKKVAHIRIEIDATPTEKQEQLLEKIYGKVGEPNTEPSLPMPNEILTILGAKA